MRKMMSALIAAVVAAVPLCSLTACNNDDGRIKITIGMWPEKQLTEDVKMFEEWERAFEAEYPQYDIVGMPYEYNPQTITTMMTSKTAPVLFQTYFTEPPKMIEAGWITDITDQLKALGWYDKMDPQMRDTISDSKGRVYGVPRDGYGLGMLVNLELLYNYGSIEKYPAGHEKAGQYKLHDDDGNPLYPTTFDEVREVSAAVTEGEAGTKGLIVLSANKNGGWQFANMAWNFGCEAMQIQGADGKWKANLNDDGAVAALEWIKGMAEDGYLLKGTSFSYLDWQEKFGAESVAMAFCGSDAVTLPVTKAKFDPDKLAFVPMPTGDGVSKYSLYGGTPYVFSYYATPQQIEGGLQFLRYMGRSPEVDEVSESAIKLGYQTANKKNMPIVPTLRPWINEDFLALVDKYDKEFVNVNMDYYSDFFDTIGERKRLEEPNYCQDMYGYLDNAIQDVLDTDKVSNCKALLTTQNNFFQKKLDTVK